MAVLVGKETCAARLEPCRRGVGNVAGYAFVGIIAVGNGVALGVAALSVNGRVMANVGDGVLAASGPLASAASIAGLREVLKNGGKVVPVVFCRKIF